MPSSLIESMWPIKMVGNLKAHGTKPCRLRITYEYGTSGGIWTIIIEWQDLQNLSRVEAQIPRQRNRIFWMKRVGICRIVLLRKVSEQN